MFFHLICFGTKHKNHVILKGQQLGDNNSLNFCMHMEWNKIKRKCFLKNILNELYLVLKCEEIFINEILNHNIISHMNTNQINRIHLITGSWRSQMLLYNHLCLFN